jgi:hypothetical protein
MLCALISFQNLEFQWTWHKSEIHNTETDGMYCFRTCPEFVTNTLTFISEAFLSPDEAPKKEQMETCNFTLRVGGRGERGRVPWMQMMRGLVLDLACSWPKNL